MEVGESTTHFEVNADDDDGDGGGSGTSRLFRSNHESEGLFRCCLCILFIPILSEVSVAPLFIKNMCP